MGRAQRNPSSADSFATPKPFYTRKKERGPPVSQDKRDRVDLTKLDAAIARGIADADAGRVHPAAEAFDELRERIRRLAETRS
jgi:hypothetical protein